MLETRIGKKEIFTIHIADERNVDIYSPDICISSREQLTMYCYPHYTARCVIVDMCANTYCATVDVYNETLLFRYLSSQRTLLKAYFYKLGGAEI